MHGKASGAEPSHFPQNFIRKSHFLKSALSSVMHGQVVFSHSVVFCLCYFGETGTSIKDERKTCKFSFSSLIHLAFPRRLRVIRGWRGTVRWGPVFWWPRRPTWNQVTGWHFKRSPWNPAIDGMACCIQSQPHPDQGHLIKLANLSLKVVCADCWAERPFEKVQAA